MGLRGQTKDSGGGTNERVLVVTCGRIYLAVSAPVIEGILPPEESAAAVVVSTRGINYHVTDLTRLFDQIPVAESIDRRVILCGDAATHRGFRVDEVVGIKDIDSRDIRPLPPHFTGDERTRFKGMFLFESGVALWANPAWLLGPDIEKAAPKPAESAEADGPKVYQLEVVDAEGTAS